MYVNFNLKYRADIVSQGFPLWIPFVVLCEAFHLILFMSSSVVDIPSDILEVQARYKFNPDTIMPPRSQALYHLGV
jgi:hypothetical protein